MRRAALLISMCLLMGCHANKPVPTTQLSASQPSFDDARPASALIFAPPIAQADPPLNLDRDIRQASAFVSYDDLTRTFLYIRTDDRWSADGSDRYERRAIMEKIGASTR
jgi:hypothetical protein